MSWFSDIFTGGVDKVVTAVTDGMDKLFTSDEEKIMLKNALQIEMNKLVVEMESKSNEYEQEVTKRWQSDNENMVTRLTRPIGFIYVYLLFGVVMLADGNIGNFHIKDTYIPLLETLLVTYTVSYVGSRGLEKYAKITKG